MVQVTPELITVIPSVLEDLGSGSPSDEESLFPEDAIVLGVSSATEISEVISVGGFTINEIGPSR